MGKDDKKKKKTQGEASESSETTTADEKGISGNYPRHQTPEKKKSPPMKNQPETALVTISEFFHSFGKNKAPNYAAQTSFAYYCGITTKEDMGKTLKTLQNWNTEYGKYKNQLSA